MEKVKFVFKPDFEVVENDFEVVDRSVGKLENEEQTKERYLHLRILRNIFTVKTKNSYEYL